MLLKIKREVFFHLKGCSYYSDGYCSCRIDRLFAGETFLLLKREPAIIHVLLNDGRVGTVQCSSIDYWKWKIAAMRLSNIKNWDGEDIFGAILLSALSFGVALGGYCAVKSVAADGKVDYCRVQQSSQSNPHTGSLYEVEGHRPWRGDQILFVSKDRDEAVHKMAEICPP